MNTNQKPRASEAPPQGEPGPAAAGGADVPLSLVPRRHHLERSVADDPVGSVYPPDVLRRQQSMIGRTLAMRPFVIALLGRPAVMVVADGTIVRLRPLPPAEMRILVALAVCPEIDDRVGFMRLVWPGAENAGQRFARLRSYFGKLIESLTVRLVESLPGMTRAEARHRARTLIRSDRRHVWLAREEYTTDIEIALSIDHCAIGPDMDDDPLLRVALAEYLAGLVRGEPLRGLDGPLARPGVEWATDWIEAVRADAQDEFSIILDHWARAAQGLGLLLDPYRSAIGRLGGTWLLE